MKPGYKQTELGEIPIDWGVDALGKHASFRTGPFGSALHKSDYIKDGVPVINPMHIVDGEILPTSAMTVTENAANALAEFRLQEGEIIIGRRGDMGRCAVVQRHQAGWLCGTGSMIIRCSDFDPNFLQRVLSSDVAISAIVNGSVGTTMVNLNQGSLSRLKVQYPPISEQSSIANALADVDALLAVQDALIAKKRAIKQGAMRALLTGKRRLPGFSGDWGAVRLGELGLIYGGLAGKSKRDFAQGSAQYVPFVSVVANVVVDINALENVDVSFGESQNLVLKGDLLFNGSSETPEEVALCALVADDVENLYLNSFCFGFRLKERDRAHGLFLSYYMRSQVGRDLVKSLAQGSTRYNISKSAFLDSLLMLPGAKEQVAIANVLSDMDAEIAALQQQRDKTAQLKQGMMQQLLTGRIRLI